MVRRRHLITLGALALMVVAVLVLVTRGGSSDASGRLVSDRSADTVVGPKGPTGSAVSGASRTPAPVTANALAFEGQSVCSHVTVAKEIVVSIHLQHEWACGGAKVVMSVPVTTGNVQAGDSTPTGTWQIEGKFQDTYLTGPGYRDFVHFWMPFYGNYGIHDAPWEKSGYGNVHYYLDHGSLGCVHNPYEAMAKLFAWTDIGTTVHVET